MKTIFNLFFSIVLMLFFGCGNAAEENKSASEKADGTEMTAPRPAPTKPETYLYLITLDKFRLRDQSNQSGKMVHQFAWGEFVEGTGKISDQKETIEIGGMPFVDHWFEVVSTTPEQKKGWIFGGGALRVYAGTRTVSPDLGKLTQFSMFLKRLDTKNYDSGKKAWDFVRSNFGDTRGTLADAALLILNDFLLQIDRKNMSTDLTQKINPQDDDWEKIMNGTFDMNRTPMTKQLENAGFRIDATEGSVFSMPDMKKMEAFFVQKVTPPMKKYLEEMTREQTERETEDGGIVISLDKLAERAVFWEIFNADHPYFVQYEITQNLERWKRWMSVVGLDNTPAFEGENGAVTPDFRTSWDAILKKYPGTLLAKKVKEVSDLVAAEGGKRTEKVNKWIEKFTTETNLD